MFREKTCPTCMSLYRGNKCKNCGYTDNENKSGIKVVWKFTIIYMLFQTIIGTLKSNFLTALLITLFAWGVLLTIPCIIKYGYKKTLNKKHAIIYTVITSILLFFSNVFISIVLNETVTLWNLLMMIIPYYILTDEPIFSKKNK